MEIISEKRNKVMLLDTDSAVLQTIDNILTLDGFQLDTALTGQDAAQKLHNNEYALFFIDIKLPDINVMELIRQIASSKPDIQIIIVTDYATLVSILESNQIHIFDYILKPFSSEQIRLTARNANSKYNLIKQNHDLLDQLRLSEEYLHHKINIATEELRRVNEKLLLQTRIDDITGLYNHRYFQERLDAEVHKALRYSQPLSLMMIDIDMFKRYNDTFGHIMGDDIIKIVGQIIHDKMRVFDLVARYGGDEFAVILPQTNGTSGVVAAEKLREIVAQNFHNIKSDISPSGLTISIGVANLPVHAQCKDKLNLLADQALYRAKREGRNRVCLPSEPNLPLPVE